VYKWLQPMRLVRDKYIKALFTTRKKKYFFSIGKRMKCQKHG